MGGVDVGSGGGGKRQTNMEINMIPFIDLLMVTIMFLLITAVWVSFSRINANAQIPGPPDPTKEIEQTTPEKVLHLHVNDTEFKLIWKQGSTTAEEETQDRPKMQGELRYDDLAKKICDQWAQHGSHKDKSDKKADQAILHTDNRMPFKEIIAVLDALYDCKKEQVVENQVKKVPVFNMSFSVR
jgi:biopolymer transport protein ExbD